GRCVRPRMPRPHLRANLVLPGHGGAPMTTATLSSTERRRPTLTFLRHLGETTVAMFVGMFAFGVVLGLIAGLAGSTFESIRSPHPGFFMLAMGASMSVTMVAWMRHRGHVWRHGWETTAAMF